MISTLFASLLALQLLLPAQALHLPAPGAPSDSVTVPDCKDGMKTKAREALVKAVKAKDPKLTYDCELAKQALQEARGLPPNRAPGGSSDGTDTGMHSSLGLAFTNERTDDYKPRKFVGDAVDSWDNDLKKVRKSGSSFNFDESIEKLPL
ncbi:hypothetical protein Y032_0015g2844 [Ancylostoma ceylanicum]|uniref:SCP domain-containing protein n=1 Tax=Ancylostoma ceylanicum TaxID=53326 RepID=A0A016V817_9BILA|nr:hypothetical protein Y032_0015g2844 [Ancylostoma ceylanicum]